MNPRPASLRRVLLAVLSALTVVLAVGLATAGPAAADPASDAVTALQTHGVYLEPGAKNRQGKTITVDESAVDTAFGGNVKAAIFASGSVSVGNRIEGSLGSGKVFAVLVPGNYQVDSNIICEGYAGSSLKRAIDANSDDVAAGNYTAALVTFGRDVVNQPRKGTAACNSASASKSGSTASGSGSGSSSAWPWILGIAVLGAGGVGAVFYSRRRKTHRELEAAKAAVMPYYDRLASDVNTLSAGDDKNARQALADASERYTSAGSQMATATTVAQWAAVRRTTLEGLQAAQTAREALGLPRGPELPAIDQARGEQLTEAQMVSVGGQQYQGYPSYTPGAPYYYGGGGGYAGGWYTFPFWETMLIGSMLGGGGWGWGGGGYGSGYDSGFSSGYEAGHDSGQSGGGDNSWGGFGGGGGSDWGGFGGGGDFGGGGSDGGSF